MHDVIAINSESPSPSDSLQEMLPNSSVETITNTLSSCGGDINSTLDNLLNQESDVKSLPEVLEKLKLQMKSRPAKLTVDQDDIFNDAIAFYKDAAFDPEVPLRINYMLTNRQLMVVVFSDNFSPTCIHALHRGNLFPCFWESLVECALLIVHKLCFQA